MTRRDLSLRADALAAERTPFAHATVVRRQRPSSVRPGDSALVLADGTIEGFVGGACAEESVRLHALRVLETGEPLLLRIVPGEDGAPAQEGAVTVQNPCLSGGALEIFIEPRLPAPRVVVLGETPIAMALERLGHSAGYDVVLQAGGALALHPDDVAVVVASHGRGEEDALGQALAAGVVYVGLVASRTRGDAVRAAIDVPEEMLARLHTPAGLDIGARTPEEIALAILAEIVAVRSRSDDAERPLVAAAPTAVDPVCGMTVIAADPAPHSGSGGETVWFCCEGCRSAFEADAARHDAAV
ncbi:MAG: xanthine dehydrogenase accessory factor [Thermoleophilaceae bacterium]|nr:xanthine dehydrogenase accessory factor [Thermoleophilaceae bacterium]